MKHTPLRKTSQRQKAKNRLWRMVVLVRASYLREEYGYIICEYSGEPILALSSVGEFLNDGWGHHIDHDRNNNTFENCYIVKYKYHGFIEDHNVKVKQEDFQGRIPEVKVG